MGVRGAVVGEMGGAGRGSSESCSIHTMRIYRRSAADLESYEASCPRASPLMHSVEREPIERAESSAAR
jgi:hypothetical protein